MVSTCTTTMHRKLGLKMCVVLNTFNLKKKTKQKTTTELLNACRNPRNYWKTIKQNCNKKSPLTDQVSSENRVNYFQNLLNMEVGSENEHLLQNITKDHDCNYLDRPISNTEIISSIKPIHSNRSTQWHLYKNV